jgi:hypothetical protein
MEAGADSACPACQGRVRFEERDLDADAGALLVCPERIASVTPLDPTVIEAIRARGA